MAIEVPRTELSRDIRKGPVKRSFYGAEWTEYEYGQDGGLIGERHVNTRNDFKLTPVDKKQIRAIRNLLP